MTKVLNINRLYLCTYFSPQASSACAHVYVVCRSLNVRSAVLQENVAVSEFAVPSRCVQKYEQGIIFRYDNSQGPLV